MVEWTKTVFYQFRKASSRFNNVGYDTFMNIFAKFVESTFKFLKFQKLRVKVDLKKMYFTSEFVVH